MSFFYHMSDRSSGINMGTLSVEVKTVDKTWFIVFGKRGNQGNTWHQGIVDLSVRAIVFSELCGSRNTHTHPTEGCWNSDGEGGRVKRQNV